MIHYALGMELALPDPTQEEPGGMTRESVLAQAMTQVALVDDYELRLILDASVPVDCPHDIEEGEMVFMIGPGVGGPIREDEAKPIIEEANALGRSGELPDALAPILVGPALGAKRSLILPPHCITQISTARPEHPMHGVAYVPAIEVKKLLEHVTLVDQVAHLSKLIDFCIRRRVVISVLQQPDPMSS